MSAPDDMAAVLAKLQKKFGVTIKEAEIPTNANTEISAEHEVPKQKVAEAARAVASKTKPAVSSVQQKSVKAKAPAGKCTHYHIMRA
jgi:hypothetical protein